MGKTKNCKSLPKEGLLQVLEEANQPKERFACVINNCSILLHKEEEKDWVALEPNSKYFKGFCIRALQNNSIESRTVKEVYEMRDWVKKIKFMWYEGQQSKSKLEKMLGYGIFMMPYSEEGDKNRILIQKNKRWNQVIIHIF